MSTPKWRRSWRISLTLASRGWRECLTTSASPASPNRSVMQPPKPPPPYADHDNAISATAARSYKHNHTIITTTDSSTFVKLTRTNTTTFITSDYTLTTTTFAAAFPICHTDGGLFTLGLWPSRRCRVAWVRWAVGPPASSSPKSAGLPRPLWERVSSCSSSPIITGRSTRAKLARFELSDVGESA